MNDRLLRAKSVDLVYFLSTHGHKPVRETESSASYLSPFRTESNPSFSVNKVSNKWMDWGPRVHGDVIDLAEKVYGCNKMEAIDHLLGGTGTPQYHVEIDVDKRKKNIEIVETHPDVTNESLVEYMEKVRKIPIDIVNKYCHEALMRFPTSAWVSHYAVACTNDLGGVVLKNRWFKGTTSPAGITTIHSEDSPECSLFEGLEDFLSHVTLNGEPTEQTIILNSVSFVPMIVDHLKTFDMVNVYIDADGAGDEQVIYLKENEVPIRDCRNVFDGYTDYNEYLQATH